MPTWEIPDAVDKLFRTLEIRAENGLPFPSDLNRLMITIRKSALFHRLLEGKEPFPIPPPKSHAYPWYHLIDNGVDHPYEVWKPKNGMSFTSYNSIVIDQSPWKLLEELAENEWIVTYPYGAPDGNGIQKFAEGKWHVYPIGSRIPREDWKNTSADVLWEIKKIE